MDDETYDMISPAGEEPWGMDASGEEVVVSGPIGHDLPCRHCGYNLRGMTQDRACPECGTAVGRSLLGDQLRFSDPQWVRTLSRGASWILWGVLTGIVLGFGGGIISVVVNASGNMAGGVDQIALLLPLVSTIIYIVGVWLITTPEPGVLEQADLSLRAVIRWAVVLSGVVTCMNTVAGMTAPTLTMSIGLVGSVVGLVGYFALFVFARRLALRVPDYDLAKQTRTVMWGIVISFSGMILFGILAGILAVVGGGAGLAVAGIPACILAVAYLVFAIWSLILLIRYKRVSNAAAEDAEMTWARDVGGQPMQGAY